MKESKLSSPIPSMYYYCCHGVQLTCLLDEAMAEGYQSRFLEFQRFESKFKACLSSSAIQTKFEQHYKRATDIIKQLEVLLTEAEHECAASWCVCVCMCVCLCMCLCVCLCLCLCMHV